MDSNDKAVNLHIDKLQGNYFKGSCIIEFYCLECKVTLDGSGCELFDGDTNLDDGYEYESDKESEYDHLFNKSEDEDGYSSDTKMDEADNIEMAFTIYVMHTLLR